MSEKTDDGFIANSLSKELGVPDIDSQQNLAQAKFRKLEDAQDRQHQRRREETFAEEETGWESLSKAVGLSDPEATEDLNQVENKIILDNLLSKLTIRQRRAVKGYYGNDMTLEEIGASMGVTVERARVIRNNGIKKLRGLIVRLDDDEKPIV